MAITATFQANFDQFVAAVKSAEAALTGVAGSAKSLGTAISASMAGTEIRRFAGELQTFAKEFIGAFAEEEAAANKLTAALKANGTFTPELMGQYKALGAEFQRTTAFSDDLMFGMTALMVQVGQVAPAQMQQALTAAANLSAGLGIDLQTATMLVAKAFATGGEGLGKLKMLLGDTVPKGADMATVMEAINSKFGGQAAAQLDTYTGRMAQLQNQMSDFKEQIGELMVNALTPLMNAFASMPQFLQTSIVAVVAIGTALAPLAITFAALSATIGPLIPLIGVALAGAFAALVPFLLPAGAIIVGITAVYLAFRNWSAITGFVQGVYEGIKTYLVDRFQALIGAIQAKVAAVTGFFRDMYQQVVGGSIVPDMIDGIKSHMGRLDEVMVKPVQASTAAVTAAFEAVSQAASRSYAAAGIGQNSYFLTGAPLRPLQGFAAGGPVTRDGPIYAHAGEYVIPKGGGAGGITVNVYGNVLSTKAELARLVKDALAQTHMSGGGRMPA